MLLKKYFLILALFTTATTWGQGKILSDTAKVNALIEEGKAFVGSDSAKAINLSNQAIELAKDASYKKGEGYAYKNMGLVYYYQGNYIEALDYWTRALEIFETIKEDAGAANMLSNIGGIYLTQGADDKALEFSLRSLKIAERMGDTVRMISALTNIGSTYHNKMDPKALDYYLKVLPLVNSPDKLEEYVVVTGNIGEIYFDSKDLDKALEYYQKSVKAAGESFSAAYSINGIGKVYLKEGKFEL